MQISKGKSNNHENKSKIQMTDGNKKSWLNLTTYFVGRKQHGTIVIIIRVLQSQIITKQEYGPFTWHVRTCFLIWLHLACTDEKSTFLIHANIRPR